MVWLKCAVVAAGVLFITVITACEYYNSRKRQRAITTEPIYNAPVGKESKCGICLNELKPSEAIVLPCKHTFCSKCLKLIFNGTQKSCCDCRKELSSHDLNDLLLKLNKLD